MQSPWKTHINRGGDLEQESGICDRHVRNLQANMELSHQQFWVNPHLGFKKQFTIQTAGSTSGKHGAGYKNTYILYVYIYILYIYGGFLK